MSGPRVDWQNTLRDLERLERSMAKGRERIAEQEKRVAQLELFGRGTTEAQAILRDFRRIQAMHETDRARLLWRLDTPEGGTSDRAEDGRVAGPPSGEAEVHPARMRKASV